MGAGAEAAQAELHAGPPGWPGQVPVCELPQGQHAGPAAPGVLPLCQQLCSGLIHPQAGSCLHPETPSHHQAGLRGQQAPAPATQASCSLGHTWWNMLSDVASCWWAPTAAELRHWHCPRCAQTPAAPGKQLACHLASRRVQGPPESTAAGRRAGVTSL